jgi:hypothetical protein
MSEHDRLSHWDRFLDAFFSNPNDLRPGGTNALQAMVAQARDGWVDTTSIPFFLPARVDSKDYIYAICPQTDQGVWIRDLLWGYLGSWVTFADSDGPVDTRPLDEAVAELVGPGGLHYRLIMGSGDDARPNVVRGLRRLTHALASRPHRRIHLTRPLGRVIGDFWDACASGSEATALDLLDTLNRDHRLSRTNALFLRLQALATFHHWDQIAALDQLPDLLRLDRPALASDALARFVMASLPENAEINDFDQLKSRFGALIPTTTAIRSTQGAQYYAYWCLSAGEQSSDVSARLEQAGWLTYATEASRLRDLLFIDSPTTARGQSAVDKEALNQALEDGRLDAAITILSRAQPTADALPILKDLVLQTLSPEALGLLKEWSDVLGDTHRVDIAFSPRPLGQQETIEPIATLGEALNKAFSTSSTTEQRAEALAACHSLAVATLMRPGAVASFAEDVRLRLQKADFSASELVDLLLGIERDLYTAGGDVPSIQDLRMRVVEAWAYGDESGDRHRANRVVVLTDRLLAAGVPVGTFDEVVEMLRAGWEPFLTDADMPLGLEAIEILSAYRPDGSSSLEAFVLPVLSRVGDHNARRLVPAALEAAQALASEFGLDLALSTEVAEAEGLGQPGVWKPPDGTLIAIYSLMESAANRSKRILETSYPGLRVEVLSKKVGHDSLKSAAKSADILVIADRAAAHAATNDLTEARGKLPIDYARGKGTASLLEATARGLERLSSSLSAAT